MRLPLLRTQTAGAFVKPRKGFALIATLTVTALLTLLVLGLLSMSNQARRSHAQWRTSAMAQANARLSLMLAMGELQRQVGPDSRITAPFDAGNQPTGGQPRWAAVYEAWKRPASPATPETPSDRVPVFRGWLVSGGNPNLGGPVGTVDQTLLVTSSSLREGAQPSDEIRVPGLAFKSGNESGQVAWWISDEGVKAKINAGPTTTAVSQPLFDTQSPRHVGHKGIDALRDFNWASGQRPVTVNPGMVNLAANLPAQGIGTFSHDISLHSAGVLADVRENRLKRDLSNLLARPVEELEDKPLYLADGRMNRFQINAAGELSNGPGMPATSDTLLNTANERGVNLEELHLFQNLHRELEWTGNQPRLVMRNSRQQVVYDRYFLYKRPVIDAVQFILSLKAEPFGAAGRYRMVMMLDGMVGLSNPNDVPIVWPAGLIFPVQLQNVPYDITWNIRGADGSVKNTTTASSSNFSLFVGRIGGGAVGAAQGFTLNPGESAVFGSTTGNGPNLDLMRGFAPSGGVRINPNTSNGWDLKATNLLPTDRIDFSLVKGGVGFAGNYTYYNAWIGDRRSGNNATGWQIDSMNLSASGDLNSARMNEFLISPIRPPEIRPVQDFITRAQPIMMISFLRNVERNSGATPPDGIASRPFQLAEPAGGYTSMAPSNIDSSLHGNQRLLTAEPLNYQFRTLAAGAGGRNFYQGGGRQPNLGGNFSVIRRRLPLAPPQSLGAFENAIAIGFFQRFKDAPAIDGDPYPSNAMALSGNHNAWPDMSKVIGNSRGTPFLNLSEVYRRGTSAAPNQRTATDHSWMANTALWDSWFLSGIVDGRSRGSNPFQTDARSPRKQFEDLATGNGFLRNTRFIFHPHRSPEAAITDLFNGENFKSTALTGMAKYLLVDGAFNVNSTSPEAWRAFLTSVRDQELLLNNGTKKAYAHPFGTLGYAQDQSTTNDWTGLRDLDDLAIRSLAEAIVTEVKARGPFLSLADFVNRRPNASDPVHQALGALQAAIDRSGLNQRFAVGQRAVLPADFSALSGSSSVANEPAPARAVGSAGFLSQAAILTAFGSQINVRSDTFTIRTYGDVRNPAGRILSRAWCEAVVQRVPDYVDPTDAPEAANGWPQANNRLAAANSQLGRRFLIRSFRWLNSDEI